MVVAAGHGRTGLAAVTDAVAIAGSEVVVAHKAAAGHDLVVELGTVAQRVDAGPVVAFGPEALRHRAWRRSTSRKASS